MCPPPPVSPSATPLAFGVTSSVLLLTIYLFDCLFQSVWTLSVEFSQEGGVPCLELVWRAADGEPALRQRRELFAVTVSLEAIDVPVKFSAVTQRPGSEGRERAGAGRPTLCACRRAGPQAAAGFALQGGQAQ